MIYKVADNKNILQTTISSYVADLNDIKIIGDIFIIIIIIYCLDLLGYCVEVRANCNCSHILCILRCVSKL